MRLDRPRIPPLAAEAWDGELDKIREGATEGGRQPPANVIATLAQHPKLLKRWMVFANHVLAKSSLPMREKELLILRVGWLCRAGYEWGQHVRIGRRAGLTDEEIGRIPKGPDAPGWSELDRLLLRAADELHTDAFVSDATWSALAERYDTRQLMDLVFTVGQYHLVSMALNSFGVPLDADIEGLPE
ncbi:MAG: hypothetical protein QOD06_975 [Candidatus Binatota bacterium]|jgi:alkylhydroperoxidase family enzyme|nr:hypothetical protein [Candidatus Binatota bacterium]